MGDPRSSNPASFQNTGYGNPVDFRGLQLSEDDELSQLGLEAYLPHQQDPQQMSPNAYTMQHAPTAQMLNPEAGSLRSDLDRMPKVDRHTSIVYNHSGAPLQGNTSTLQPTGYPYPPLSYYNPQALSYGAMPPYQGGHEATTTHHAQAPPFVGQPLPNAKPDFTQAPSDALPFAASAQTQQAPAEGYFAPSSSITGSSAGKAKRTRTNEPRVGCKCVCGCHTSFYLRKNLDNFQCAPCKKNRSGRCSAPAQQGGLPTAFVFTGATNGLVLPVDSQQRPSTRQDLLSQGSGLLVNTLDPRLAGCAFTGPPVQEPDRPDYVAHITGHPGADAATFEPHTRRQTVRRKSTQAHQDPGSAPLFVPVYDQHLFATFIDADKHLRGESIVTVYHKLTIDDDDLDDVQQHRRHELAGLIFNNLSGVPVPAPADLKPDEQIRFNNSQKAADTWVKNHMSSNGYVQDAIARVHMVVKAAEKLHADGIPEHLLDKRKATTETGLKVDVNSKLSERLQKVAEMVSNKLVAKDVLKGHEIDDLVRAPEAYAKRKGTNFKCNTGKGMDLQSAAQARKEEAERTAAAEAAAGGVEVPKKRRPTRQETAAVERGVDEALIEDGQGGPHAGNAAYADLRFGGSTEDQATVLGMVEEPAPKRPWPVEESELALERPRKVPKRADLGLPDSEPHAEDAMGDLRRRWG